MPKFGSSFQSPLSADNFRSLPREEQEVVARAAMSVYDPNKGNDIEAQSAGAQALADFRNQQAAMNPQPAAPALPKMQNPNKTRWSLIKAIKGEKQWEPNALTQEQQSWVSDHASSEMDPKAFLQYLAANHPEMKDSYMNTLQEELINNDYDQDAALASTQQKMMGLVDLNRENAQYANLNRQAAQYIQGADPSGKLMETYNNVLDDAQKRRVLDTFNDAGMIIGPGETEPDYQQVLRDAIAKEANKNKPFSFGGTTEETQKPSETYDDLVIKEDQMLKDMAEVWRNMQNAETDEEYARLESQHTAMQKEYDDLQQQIQDWKADRAGQKWDADLQRQIQEARAAGDTARVAQLVSALDEARAQMAAGNTEQAMNIAKNAGETLGLGVEEGVLNMSQNMGGALQYANEASPFLAWLMKAEMAKIPGMPSMTVEEIQAMTAENLSRGRQELQEIQNNTRLKAEEKKKAVADSVVNIAKSYWTEEGWETFGNEEQLRQITDYVMTDFVEATGIQVGHQLPTMLVSLFTGGAGEGLQVLTSPEFYMTFMGEFCGEITEAYDKGEEISTVDLLCKTASSLVNGYIEYGGSGEEGYRSGMVSLLQSIKGEIGEEIKQGAVTKLFENMADVIQGREVRHELYSSDISDEALINLEELWQTVTQTALTTAGMDILHAGTAGIVQKVARGQALTEYERNEIGAVKQELEAADQHQDFEAAANGEEIETATGKPATAEQAEPGRHYVPKGTPVERVQAEEAQAKQTQAEDLEDDVLPDVEVNPALEEAAEKAMPELSPDRMTGAEQRIREQDDALIQNMALLMAQDPEAYNEETRAIVRDEMDRRGLEVPEEVVLPAEEAQEEQASAPAPVQHADSARRIFVAGDYISNKTDEQLIRYAREKKIGNAALQAVEDEMRARGLEVPTEQAEDTQAEPEQTEESAAENEQQTETTDEEAVAQAEEELSEVTIPEIAAAMTAKMDGQETDPRFDNYSEKTLQQVILRRHKAVPTVTISDRVQTNQQAAGADRLAAEENAAADTTDQQTEQRTEQQAQAPVQDAPEAAVEQPSIEDAQENVAEDQADRLTERREEQQAAAPAQEAPLAAAEDNLTGDRQTERIPEAEQNPPAADQTAPETYQEQENTSAFDEKADQEAAETARKAAAEQYHFKVGGTRGNGSADVGVHLIGDVRKISKKNLMDLQIIDRIAKWAHFSVEVVDGLDHNANGEYDGGRTLYLNINTENALSTVASHEMWHMVKRINADGAKRIQAIWEKWADRTGFDVTAAEQNMIRRYGRQGVALTPAAAREELIANSFYTFMGDRQVMRQVYAENAGVFERVMNFVKRVQTSIREMLGEYEENTPEAQMLAEQDGALTELHQTMLDVLNEMRDLDGTKKAVSAVKANGEMTRRFETAVKEATNKKMITQAARELGGDVLRKTGNQAGQENFTRLMNAAQDVNDLGTLPGAAMRDNGLSYAQNDAEVNRALQKLGAYAAQLKAEKDVQEYVELVNGVSQEDGAKYSIATGPNGDYVSVDTDQKQFEGKTLTEKRRLARKIIIEKYGRQVIDRNHVRAYVKSDAADEYAYPAKRLDKNIAESKMMASPELENLLRVSVFENHVGPNKHHPEYAGGWDYYRTHFYVNNTMYEGKVNIGILKDGRRQFYDVTDLKEDPLFGTSGQSTNVLAASDSGSSGDIISQNDPTVKQNLTVKSESGEQLTEGLEGGSVAKYSLGSWENSDRAKIRKALMDQGFTRKQANKWIDDINGIAAMIAEDRTRLDYRAADNQVFLKDNAEYVKTLDSSTLCAKRRLYQGTFDAIQHELPNTVITSDLLIHLRNMMADRGYETPCGICYVESRRRNLGAFTDRFLKNYEGDSTGFKPTMSDLTTTDGLEALRTEHPEAYEAYRAAMAKTGSNNPKVVQPRTEYRGEITQLTPGQVEKIVEIGGLRVQSFSDFETPHLIDMMQAVTDMAGKGLTSQAYTKVPNFAAVFGGTGIKINLSLIADGTGLDENGNLVYSSYEGMDIKRALELRDQYPDDVGTIIVGVSDEHILAAMKSEDIDFIIPFHKSGWGKKQLEQLTAMRGYHDYTADQNERRIVGETKTGKARLKKVEENFHPVDYWDYEKSGKENAEIYLRMCAEDGRVPKFARFLVNNGDGSYSLQPDGSTDGYWKLLGDFKMYNHKTGKGTPQRAVTPDFNMDEARRVMAEYEGGADTLPVAQDVVRDFVDEYKGEHPRAKYSLPAETKDIFENTRNELDNELPQTRQEIGQQMVELNRELQQLRSEIKQFENNTLTEDMLNRMTGKDKAAQDQALKEYGEAEKKAGIKEKQDRIKELDQRISRLYKQSNAVRVRTLQDDIRKSGLSQEEYFRKAAVKEFGYTPYYYDAGYILPNGKMLNFSGEKGKHYGTRGQDHRAISTIFEGALDSGTAALNAFVNMGNIRIMDESPGVDIAVDVKLTPEQRTQLRKHIRERISKNGYYVDFTTGEGRTLASLEYSPSTSVNKILADIDYVQQTGEAPRRSDVASFHTMYSLPDNPTEDDMRQHSERQMESTGGQTELMQSITGKLWNAIVDRKQMQKQDRYGDWRQQVSELAQGILEDTNSQTMSAKELESRLTQIFEEYEGKKTGTAEEAENAVNDALNEIRGLVEEALSDQVMDEHYRTNKDALRKGIYLNKDMQKELGSAAEVRDFRNAMSGFTRVYTNEAAANKAGALHLDGHGWDELQSVDPSLFNPETHWLERPQALRDFVEQYRDSTAMYDPMTRDYIRSKALEVMAGYYTGSSETDAGKRTKAALDKANKRVRQLTKQAEVSLQKQLDLEQQVRDAKAEAKTAKDEAWKQEIKATRPLQDTIKQLNEQIKAAREETKASGQELTAARDEAEALRDQLETADNRAAYLDNTIRILKQENKKNQEAAVRDDRRRNREKAKQRAEAVKARNNIKKTSMKLRRMMENPSNTAYIPKDYVRQLLDVVEAAQTADTRRVAQATEKWMRTVREMRTDNQNFYQANAFDQGFTEQMQEVCDILNDKNINRLEGEELQYVSNVLTQAAHQIDQAAKLIGRQRNEDAFLEGHNFTETINAQKGTATGGIRKAAHEIAMQHLSPEREFNKLAGYRTDNAVYRTGQELVEGQRAQKMMEMELSQCFEDLMTGKNAQNFRKFAGKNAELIDTGIQGSRHGTFKITHAQLTALLMHSKNQQNVDGMKNGLTVPDYQLMKQGKTQEAWARAERLMLTPQQLKQLVAQATEYDKAWAAAWQQAQAIAQPRLNQTSMDLNGWYRFQVENYFPIRRDKNYLATDFESLQMDGTIAGMGFTKARKNASNPMMLEDIYTVAQRYINGTSLYVGMAIPVSNFNKVFNAMMPGYEDSPKAALRRVFGSGEYEYIERLLTDIQTGGRKTDSSVMDKLRGKAAGSALGANMSVMIKQAASYPTAAAEIGWKPLMQALTSNRKFDEKLVQKYTSAYWERTSANVQAMNANTQANAIDRTSSLMGAGITGMDKATVRKIWIACEFAVEDENKSLQRGTDAYYEEVARKFELAVERTQPEYGVMQRPHILRSNNQLTKAVTMYKTQSMQNFNILYDAVQDYRAQAERYKADQSTENKAELDRSKTKLARAVSSQVVSAVVLAIMTAVGKALLHKPEPYQDDKGELTAGSVSYQLSKDMISSMAGMMVGGSELFDLIVGIGEGKAPYDIEAGSISMVNDLYQAAYKLGNAASAIADSSMSLEQKMQKAQKAGTTFLESVAAIYGIPMKNMENIGTSVYKYVDDIISGRGLEGLTTGDVSLSTGARYMGQALQKGDQETYVRLYNRLLRQGKTQSQINSAMKTWMKQNDPRIQQAANAIDGGDIDTYNRLINEMTADGYGMANVVTAIESVRKAAASAESGELSVESGVNTPLSYDQIMAAQENDSASAYTYAQLNQLLESGNTQAARKVQSALFKSKGTTAVKSALTSYWKPKYQEAYQQRNRTELNRIVRLLKSMGYSDSSINKWKTAETTTSSSKKKSSSRFGGGFGGSFGSSKKKSSRFGGGFGGGWGG